MSSAEKMDLGSEMDVDGTDWTTGCVMGGLESGGRGIGIGLSERDGERGRSETRAKAPLTQTVSDRQDRTGLNRQCSLV
jgi:hypothetical protein